MRSFCGGDCFLCCPEAVFTEAASWISWKLVVFCVVCPEAVSIDKASWIRKFMLRRLVFVLSWGGIHRRNFLDQLFIVLSWGGIHSRSFLDQEVLLRRYSQTQLPGSAGSLCWRDCFLCCPEAVFNVLDQGSQTSSKTTFSSCVVAQLRRMI